MVLLSFNMLDKAIDIRQGKCNQTIRPPRKREWVKGDLLHLWYKSRTKKRMFLGMGVLVYVKRVKFGDITEATFIRDGFRDKAEAHRWFLEVYRHYVEQYFKANREMPFPDGLRAYDVLEACPFDILRWEQLKIPKGDAPPPKGQSPFPM